MINFTPISHKENLNFLKKMNKNHSTNYLKNSMKLSFFPTIFHYLLFYFLVPYILCVIQVALKDIQFHCI